MAKSEPVVINRTLARRLGGELKLLMNEPLSVADARPDDSNFLKWYFVIKGAEQTPYENGWYIGVIELDPEHPYKPPNFKVLTPSGRFLVDQKICLSNSTYHSNEWSPEWNIKSMLLGMISIWLDDKEHGISHIHYGDAEKISYAKESIEFNKKHYLNILKKFPQFFDENGDPKETVVDRVEDSTIENDKSATKKPKRAPRKKINQVNVN